MVYSKTENALVRRRRLPYRDKCPLSAERCDRHAGPADQRVDECDADRRRQNEWNPRSKRRVSSLHSRARSFSSLPGPAYGRLSPALFPNAGSSTLSRAFAAIRCASGVAPPAPAAVSISIVYTSADTKKPTNHASLKSQSNSGIQRPISAAATPAASAISARGLMRSEEHTSELQSLRHLVCRLLLEKK